MDPHAEQVPGLALPKPSSEQGMHNIAPYQSGAAPEAMLPTFESGRAPAGASMRQQQVPAMPTQSIPAVPTPTLAPPISIQATDDNSDSLDEEWISKAKAIVAQTKHDPHLESQELGRVKADYLRIRYNRHIKVVEDNNK